MAPLLFLLVLAAVAVLAPLLGKDTSASASARYEDRRDDRTWWPAGPDALPRPRF